jgi:hypothetical protein
MRFHGLMLLRDEEDVIAQNLQHLLTWIDSLYILDLGSNDRTWEIVQDFAKRDARIVPFMHKPILYNDNLRSFLFHHFRARFQHGDWVMKIDADEFYHVTPPNFVKERLHGSESAVHLQWYFFRLTQSEVQAYERGEVNIAEDRHRPIEDRRRYYKISEYAEPRMFRYRKSMQWPEDASFPYNAGLVARERIPIRHYPHRDPEQMRRRFRLRAAMMKLNAHAGGHWKLEDWRQDVVDDTGASASQTAKQGGIGNFSNIDSGPLLYWQPGTPLQEQPLLTQRGPALQRTAKWLTYNTMLPILDRRRKQFDPSFQPHFIDEAINAQID